MNQCVGGPARIRFQYYTNRFQPGHQMGSGKFSKVWSALDIETGNPVAIKQLHLEEYKSLGDEEDPANAKANSRLGVDISLLWELKALSRVKHENVIEIISVTFKVDPPSILILLPLLDVDLNGLLADKNLVMTEALFESLSYQICSGMAACHELCIIHRDLKPANMMLNRSDGCLKIIDFGWSRSIVNPLINMRSEGCPGTPYYRSPETITHSEHYGIGIDTWAVACTIVELILRVPLFGFSLCQDRRSPFSGCRELLKLIFTRFGVPSDVSWPSLHLHSCYSQIEELVSSIESPFPYDPSTLPTKIYEYIESRGVTIPLKENHMLWEVLGGMFTLDPVDRITTSQARDSFKIPPPKVPPSTSSIR
eukprot:TRINITY_DN3674_c0_g1_i1.p1 TRINITY_DN3674_c0_g1~~TRINITY_DN3674_c0_g1_i1.p1  ORF type:complete len:367 (+),score=50.94 TRINITY_DN3674_c0_g1_i1:43-1143(+)